VNKIRRPHTTQPHPHPAHTPHPAGTSAAPAPSSDTGQTKTTTPHQKADQLLARPRQSALVRKLGHPHGTTADIPGTAASLTDMRQIPAAHQHPDRLDNQHSHSTPARGNTYTAHGAGTRRRARPGHKRPMATPRHRTTGDPAALRPAGTAIG
jgi:hypothetical protein